MLLAPLVQGRKGEYKSIFEEMRRAGYVRVRVDGNIMDLSDEIELDKQKKHTIEVVVDRLVMRKGQKAVAQQPVAPLSEAKRSAYQSLERDDQVSPLRFPTPTDGIYKPSSLRRVAERPMLYDVNVGKRSAEAEDGTEMEARSQQESVDLAFRQRLADSLETTLKLGGGVVLVSIIDGEEILFSEKLACVYCGISLPEIAPRTFSFNNPHGACPTCTGLGTQQEIDAELIVTHPELSLLEGAIAPWSKVINGSQWHASILEALAKKYDFSLHTPWRDLTEDQRQKVLYGTPDPLTIRYTPQHGQHTQLYHQL